MSVQLHISFSVSISYHENAYGVDVVRSWPPATDHDNGGPLANEPFSLSLLYALNEAFLHVIRPVLLAFLRIEHGVNPSVHVTLNCNISTEDLFSTYT